jgi:aspartate racemase
MTQTRTLGLIGGLGLEAGIYYYEHLAKAHEQRGELLHLVLVHAHAPTAVGHMFAGEREQLAQYLLGFIRQLAAAGAELAAIPAVTPHACIDLVVRESPIPVVSILDALACELDARGVRRIALFGTKFVIESELYGSLPPSTQAVRPSDEETARIDHLYRSYAVQGVGGDAERAEFDELGKRIAQRERLDAIVLAGTDLSALYEGREPAFPFIDASKVHIDAIMRELHA